jgi:hypothetical protein
LLEFLFAIDPLCEEFPAPDTSAYLHFFYVHPFCASTVHACVCRLNWVYIEVLISANIILLTGGERTMMAEVGQPNTLTNGPRGMSQVVVGPSGVTNGMNVSTQLVLG